MDLSVAARVERCRSDIVKSDTFAAPFEKIGIKIWAESIIILADSGIKKKG